MRSAPAAITCALSFGQACRGLTSRSRERPKFAMARAAAPIFSPIWDSTRITTGPGVSIHRLVLSVPAPGMTPLMHGGDGVVEMFTERTRHLIGTHRMAHVFECIPFCSRQNLRPSDGLVFAAHQLAAFLGQGAACQNSQCFAALCAGDAEQ